jgi:hypothetical protein
MENFEAYREAAREGIATADGSPVLVEDYPGLPVSPRSACLDGVASCDIFVLITGSRGGWKTPSGKLVVEEEYEEALKRKLRILAFIQNVKRDTDAEHLVNKLSDYVDGRFRTTFNTPSELQVQVEKALVPQISYWKNPEVDLKPLKEKLQNPYEIQNEASIRFIISLLDPVTLESSELEEQIQVMAHSTEVKLFSYNRGKETNVGVNEIVILQDNDYRRWDEADVVRLEITSEGIITIDANVTGLVKRGGDYDFISSMAIIEDDISIRLRQCFAFTNEFFNKNDPYKRYDRFLFNATLSNIGHRTLMAEPPKGSSITMGQTGDKIIIAFDKPRAVTRVDLINPNELIKQTLTMLRRRIRQ